MDLENGDTNPTLFYQVSILMLGNDSKKDIFLIC